MGMSLAKLMIWLLMVAVTSGKKAKKRFPEPEDNSEDYNADIFCKKMDRLIKMRKADEINVVDSCINGSVLLQCKYCEEKDNDVPKIWSRQKHIFTGNITEVETNMDNNVSASFIFISKSHSLVFRSLKETDAGLYFCKPPYVDSPEYSFNYLIDFSEEGPDDIKGSLTDLKNFTQFYLADVNKQLSNKTFIVRGLIFKIKVFTDWSDWSDCDSWFRREGTRYRLGRCRVKPICQDAKDCTRERNKLQGFVFSDKQNTEKPTQVQGVVSDVKSVTEYVMGYGIALSCRSLLLKELTPDVFNITSTIPNFMLTEKCMAPIKRSFKKGPRYRKSIILAKGAHLTLVCPDSTIDSEIRWEHNKRGLNPNEGKDYALDTNEPRQYVDSFNTLYLFDVTDKESGNYTCFVDGVRMQEVRIIVLTRSLFFTKEFTRHLKYLGLVFLICFFIYLGGVTFMCVKSHSEKWKQSKKKKRIAKERKELISLTIGSDSDSQQSDF